MFCSVVIKPSSDEGIKKKATMQAQGLEAY